MASALRSEVGWLLLLVLGVGMMAAMAGHVLWWPLLAASIYALWHLSQALRLLLWLRRDSAVPGANMPPQSLGLWAMVFAELYRSQHRFKQEHQRLHKAANTVYDIAKAFSEAVVMVDERGAIIWCNSVATRLLGMRMPEDQGALLVSVLREPEFIRYFHRSVFAEPLTLRLVRKPNIYVSVEVTEYGIGERMVMVRDVTKVTRLERMRVDFVANVSHELRTPLTVINGYLETLHSLDAESVPLAMLARALQPMQAQCSRMEALVNDLTTLSRLESRTDARDSGQIIEVAELVSRLVAEAPLTPDDGKCISCDVAPQALLLGQEKEIHSAFGNLISNACKYTAPGGQVHITWRVEAGRAVFEVSDDGEGIAAEHLPRLTERFYRVDKSRSVSTGGTGLGLAIAKHALMRHQAMLEIESEPGQGSCFRCVFPLHRVQLR